ncbi:STAS domain-containing protein [Virgisporangium aurantiacum]|uniref:Anti-sigma factor antagonist n=1 Tax=Virgisporangium aurantiacum TaxID=175570 RepID=A0A8J3ZHT2_9ACTN|nr:STAS domain-containing protein [Virgisporangium aurantiacum]GIJ64459.1 hypothetical protein Vau01_119750 [Virgisporangium aurantiacum]
MTASAYLTVNIMRRIDHCVVVLDGELDANNAPELTEHLRLAVAADAIRIVVDASMLHFCDLAGIRVLMNEAKRCTAAGGWLRLATPQRHLELVLAVTGLLSALPTYRSVVGAVVARGTERITG